MMDTLRALANKILAVGLLVLALVSIAVCVILPVADHYQTLQSELETKRILLGRVMAQPAASDSAFAAQLPANATHLQGETDAVRLATLQSIMNDAAGAQGIRLISSRSVDAGERDGIRLLGVSAQLSATIEALQRLLYDLESNHGALAIEGLHIMRPAGESRAGELDVSLVLRGTAPGLRE